jgi:hypothetical protein
MYIHHTSITIHVLLLVTHLPFSWAGWLSSIPFVRYTKFLSRNDFCFYVVSESEEVGGEGVAWNRLAKCLLPTGPFIKTKADSGASTPSEN